MINKPTDGTTSTTDDVSRVGGEDDSRVAGIEDSRETVDDQPRSALVAEKS